MEHKAEGEDHRSDRREKRDSNGDREAHRHHDRQRSRTHEEATNRNSTDKTDVPQNVRYVAFLRRLPSDTTANDIKQLFYDSKITSISLHFTPRGESFACNGEVEFDNVESLARASKAGVRIRDQEIRVRTLKLRSSGKQQGAYDASESYSDAGDTRSERKPRAIRRRGEPREHRAHDGDSTRPAEEGRPRRRDAKYHRTEDKDTEHVGSQVAPQHEHKDDSSSDSSEESIEQQEARYRYQLQYYNDDDPYGGNEPFY